MTALLVANDGGHIMQLHTLRQRLLIDDDVVWVTPQTPQTMSLLEGESVFWADPCPTRDLRAVVRNARRVRPLFRCHDVRLVVSTGAALALSVLPQARLRGIETVYIESATRVSEPSLTGSILARFPGIKMYSQSQNLLPQGWDYLASPWEVYQVEEAPVPRPIRSVVVSLGTSEKYGFRRMLESLIPLIPAGARVLWQTGSTDVRGLDIDARASVPAEELHEAMRQADVVVSHAGTGVALAALEAGKCPILIPRRGRMAEHVDDHQLQIALDFALRDLAIVRDAAFLKDADLVTAASRVVRRVDAPRLRISANQVSADGQLLIPQPRSGDSIAGQIPV